MTRIPIGKRIRDSRKRKGLAQSALARQVGISPSYLNLIEHDKRLISGALLNRIAQALGLDRDRLSGVEEGHLAQDVAEMARSLSLPGLDEDGAARLIAQDPDWAHALLALHKLYLDSSETALALSDRLSQDPALMELSHTVLTRITAIRSFAEILEQHPKLPSAERLRFSGIIASQSDELGSSARAMIALLEGAPDALPPTTPAREVDGFMIYHGNHFAVLEEAAERLCSSLAAEGEPLETAIARRLSRVHGVSMRYRERGAQAQPVPPEQALLIEERALPATIRFRQARRLAELEMPDLLDRLIVDEHLSSDEARLRGRRALANYAAAALLFPYRPFLEAAEAFRYDLDRLALRFGGSFEQIAHRLVTLRRPGAEGIPFAFLRTDPAGNISKPFSIAGLRMPRFGGACPLWAVYAAFSSADRTVAQLAEMPQGERFLFIARRVSKRASVHGEADTLFSIMLGCDAAYRDRIVYGDAFAAARQSMATPVGFNCRSCRREDCSQRAQPAILSSARERSRAEAADME